MLLGLLGSSLRLARIYRDVLIVKADRQETLVVLRMSLAAEIAKPPGTNERLA